MKAELNSEEREFEEHIAPRISVETFNGASHMMPPGVRAKHKVRDMDPVALSIGCGTDAPAIHEFL